MLIFTFLHLAACDPDVPADSYDLLLVTFLDRQSGPIENLKLSLLSSFSENVVVNSGIT